MNFSRHLKYYIKNPLIIGTFLLTISGALSRIIGFFYRIFLSHTIGAEGIGIYQLIFPVYALCFSLTAAGIQTSISKFVAEVSVKKGDLTEKCYLLSGLILSLSLSFLCSFYLYNQADFLAYHVVHEYRTAPLLRILAYAIPCGTVHACISGYYYGIKKATIPSLSQLLEQIIRVVSVYLIYHVQVQDNIPITPAIAVWGIVCGEIASALFSTATVRFCTCRLYAIKKALPQVGKLAIPLTGNRVILNLFASMEAILIPLKLREAGLSTSAALSTFGILTGMALPLIMFPTSITNSLAVMLLPAISEASAAGEQEKIKKAVSKSITYCMLFGFACTIFFFLGGKPLGITLFNNRTSGSFIMLLSFICPFLYLTSTLAAILNGLGKTLHTFFYNLASICIRLLFALFAIPIFGIKGYLWGLLVSQIFLAVSLTFSLREYIK
ncbi:MAG: polysaccharide biosynthesis protein [Lachnospiraceae bacterium]|nr:polysaccharide biosynthesis protein [Lachnospiraceae bacterium]